MTALGKHCLIDIYDCDPNLLQDADALFGLLYSAAITEGKATYITHNMHSFGEEQGITCFMVLAESHISIHTWPEKRFAAIDVFMCGETSDIYACKAFIISAFKDADVNIHFVRRGDV